MDWENERYVRRYCRETVDDVMLSWEARALWDALLPRFDRAGVLDIGAHGWRGVSILVRIPAEVVERCGAELERDGRVEVRGQYLLAPNYVEANEARSSDRQRQAESRARRRDRAKASQLGLVTFATPESVPVQNLTLRPNEATSVTSVSQNVTKQPKSVTSGHTTSHRVTPCLAVPSRASTPPTPSRGFDWERAYRLYPKKAMKAAGMKALADRRKKLVTTEAQFQRLLLCCEWMAAKWEGHDLSYCPGWGPFVNQKRWEDEQWPAPKVEPESKASAALSYAHARAKAKLL